MKGGPDQRNLGQERNGIGTVRISTSRLTSKCLRGNMGGRRNLAFALNYLTFNITVATTPSEHLSLCPSIQCSVIIEFSPKTSWPVTDPSSLYNLLRNLIRPCDHSCWRLPMKQGKVSRPHVFSPSHDPLNGPSLHELCRFLLFGCAPLSSPILLPRLSSS